MKTVYLILSFVFLQYIGVSQTEQSAAASAGCPVIYSESESAIILKDASLPLCSDLVFETLPPVTQTLVPVKLALKKGTYNFKKDANLSVPDGLSVVVEDTMTGATFDLLKDESLKFNVTRTIPDRFVMFVSKTKPSVAAK